MKKQVTVTYSKDLLRRYFSYVFDKKGTRTKTVFAVSAAVFAVFCVLSVIFYSRNTVVADVNLFYVFLGISVISLAVIAVYALAMCLYPRLSSKKMSRTLGRTVVYEFSENSFSAALPDGRGKKLILTVLWSVLPLQRAAYSFTAIRPPLSSYRLIRRQRLFLKQS